MEARLVFGKYEIQHRLAVGGMGEVFYALQRGGLERPVILKSLLPELAEKNDFVEQFLDEARLAATLNHPNVVSLFEVGQSSGTYFLAMEYIRGRNLAQLMQKATENGVSVPRSVAFRIIRDAALGLDHAHTASDVHGRPLNIVHRDVSPQNIMVREDGVTKLLDFGIARAANRTTRTATGVLKGKLAYMAPEQLLSAYVGPRVDQYALGVVLWELLCKRPLFRAANDAELMRKVIEAHIPRPSSVVPIDAATDALVMRMLERESTRRFASCGDVSKALDGLIAATRGVVESPAEFMRRLGTSDLVVGPRVDSKDFIIDLRPTAQPRNRLDELTTPLARAPSATHEPPFSGVARTTGSVRVTPSPGAAATSRTLTTHVVSDLHWKTLHSDNWLTVRVDDQNRVVLYARRPVQFEDPGQVESAHRAAIEALKPLVRARLGLLVDLRNAPDSAEPAAQGRPALRKAEMEAAMAEQRPRLLRDFGRLAFLLKTAVGKLQLDRHLRNDGFDAHITSDEAEALSYLLAQPR